MFRWFTCWLERRRLRHRALFRYWNGAEWRSADPAILWRDIHALPDVELPALVRLADAGREPEATILHDHLLRVFDLEPLDPETGRGLSRWEVHALLNQFYACLQSLKKKFRHGWMPWQLWVLEDSTGQEDRDAVPKSSSDSASASTASGSNASTTSPAESRPASVP